MGLFLTFALKFHTGMPTPATELNVSMQGNCYLLTNDDAQWKVCDKISPGRDRIIDDARYFTIADNIRAPLLTEALCVPTELKINAKFPRTNVEFADFQKPKIPLTVMHPLEISLVAGARATVFDCAVPITITLRNKSRVGYGLGAVYTRRVRVTVELAGGDQDEDDKQHLFATNDNGQGDKRTPYSLGAPVIYDVDFIAGRSEMVLSGTISIDPLYAKLYEEIKLHYSLLLGDLDNPVQESAMEVIQAKSHTLQVIITTLNIARYLLLLTVFTLAHGI